jgi:hypothetical protein
MTATLLTLAPYKMVLGALNTVIDDVNAEDMVPINSELITKPTRIQTTANTRPARVLAVLSPYLQAK